MGQRCFTKASSHATIQCALENNKSVFVGVNKYIERVKLNETKMEFPNRTPILPIPIGEWGTHWLGWCRHLSATDVQRCGPDRRREHSVHPLPPCARVWASWGRGCLWLLRMRLAGTVTCYEKTAGLIRHME